MIFNSYNLFINYHFDFLSFIVKLFFSFFEIIYFRVTLMSDLLLR